MPTGGRRLSGKQKEGLLNFIIYNVESFATSGDFFKAACKVTGLKEEDVNFLDENYDKMDSKCRFVKNREWIPANELTFEQKLLLADVEKSDKFTVDMGKLHAIVTRKLLTFFIDNEESFATPGDFLRAACNKLGFKEEDAKFLETGYNDMAKKCGRIGVDEQLIPANKLTVEQRLHLDEFCEYCIERNLHDGMPQKLLDFLIYNKEPFSKSEDFFKAACEKLNIIEKYAKFLEILYNEMAVKCGLVDITKKVIHANKLTIEQKLDLADAEKFDIKARFVKDYFLKKRTEDIVMKINKMFISDSVALTEKSSSAKVSVEAKNSPNSSASSERDDDDGTSTSTTKSKLVNPKNRLSSTSSDSDFK
ncbi:hypothetical protein B9Z55_026812 [Caenorhabditis nigoni]|uniref:Uncharacterized protein n=1 Tax=Caenorhabditis nigoni TaxID=1611254 RepID=A0A2G5SHE0_9PELO|nr:hypothetical protein B9Z55_026812 [Caenorhabditis nigoni]